MGRYSRRRWGRGLGGCRERLCEFFAGSLCYRRLQEIEISSDEVELLTEKGSGVEISRGKCSGAETSRE